ncbi:glycosyltransferase, partial [Escherichia coli]|uniref:glycosyltransferase n=1 Tax=Escherichia coli TaxID=562 RepID=UPI00390CB3A9
YILGIEESVGSYITFVDSDDWIEPSMYEKMLKYFDIKDVNMVICKYDTIIDNIGIESNFGIKEGVLGQADKYKFFHSPNTLRI